MRLTQTQILKMYSHYWLGVDHRSVAEGLAFLRKDLVVVRENFTFLSEDLVMVSESFAIVFQFIVVVCENMAFVS